MIQSVVSRLAGNSAQAKTWCVTLVAAVLALGVKDADHGLAWIAVVPTLVLWVLDAYYLKTEREYRALFDAVRNGSGPTDFDLGVKAWDSGIAGLARAAFSRSVIPAYAVLASAIIVVAIVGE